MGMGIGINDNVPDDGIIRGIQNEIACDAWFTASGRIIIRLIKYKKKDESIVEIENIHVISSTKKNFCGIPTVEFKCKAEIDNILESFKIFFYVEEQKWKMMMY